jgi:hypothetical protein
MCFFFFFCGVETGFTLGTIALEPYHPWFFMVSSKKWGTMRFYRPWPKDSKCKLPITHERTF